jgi:hypothetical protein
MLFNSAIAAAILGFTAAAVPMAPSAPGNASSTSTAPTKPVSPETIKEILLAPIAQDRFKLLDDNANFLFDFGASDLRNAPGGLGGDLTVANRKNFPALIGAGSGMAVGFLDGCGFNSKFFSQP